MILSLRQSINILIRLKVVNKIYRLQTVVLKQKFKYKIISVKCKRCILLNIVILIIITCTANGSNNDVT